MKSLNIYLTVKPTELWDAENQLHVLITPELSAQLRLDKNGLAVLKYAKDYSEDVKTPKGILICTRERSSLECKPLNLCVSELFLSEYSLSTEMEYKCLPTKGIPLEKVVIGSRSSRTFQTVRKPDFCRRLLVQLTQTPLLFRMKDYLLVPNDIYPEMTLEDFKDLSCLSCSPISQGILTTNTSIVVSRLPSLKGPTKTLGRSNSNDSDALSSKSFKETDSDSSVQSYLNLMNFTSRLMLPPAAQFVQPLSKSVLKSLAMSSTALGHFRTYKLNVVIQPKPCCQPCILGNLNFYPLEEENLNIRVPDPNSTLFLSPHQIWKLFQGKEGEWVFVKLHSEHEHEKMKLRRSSSLLVSRSPETLDEDPMPSYKSLDLDFPEETDPEIKGWRMARVYCAIDCLEAKDCLLSPQLWFNLNPHPSPLLQPFKQLSMKKSLLPQTPPYANEVYLALIRSPKYHSNFTFDLTIKKHFNLTRYLQKGDIIALSSQGDVQFHQSMENTSYFRWPTVYFLVSRIEGPPSSGYRVDTRNSRLYQSGTSQSYVPTTMETYYSTSEMHNLWHSPSHPALEKTIIELCSLLEPFLKSKKMREQVPANILLRGPTGCGKRLSVTAVCRCLNLHLFPVDCQELLGDAVGATEARLRNTANKTLDFAPCVLLLRNVSVLARDKEATGEDPRMIATFCSVLSGLSGSSAPPSAQPVIVIATAADGSPLHPDLASLFLHQVTMEAPNEVERIIMLESLLQPLDCAPSVNVPSIAHRTAGLSLGDLKALVTISAEIAYGRVVKHLSKNNYSNDEELVCLSGVPIQGEDLRGALEQLQSFQAQAIGAPKIPNVRWDDVGGLDEVKSEILDTVQLPLLHPELLQTGLRRSGLLLHGPPGTGKTLLAKAVATECSLSFLSVKGPELINMYVGQSEENVREVFHRARRASPSIIFFDELDSLAPNRGRSGDSGGVMDRVVSQLLAELDGLHKSADVFVIGATNRPDLIDPALLRPGRFDRLVEVGLPRTKEERLDILKALTRKMLSSDDVDLDLIESKCPIGLSGADFYSLCSEAQMKALERCIVQIENSEREPLDLVKPVVNMNDFLYGISNLVPSSRNYVSLASPLIKSV